MQAFHQHIQHTCEDLLCCKCGNTEGTFINLECDHMFCMLCASFMYAKYRKTEADEGTIKCAKCGVVTELAQEYIDLINETLQNEVLPNIDPQEKLTIPKNNHPISNGNRHIETISRKIKSEQHSFEQNFTPSTAKCFFSKCESPSSRKRSSNPRNLQCCGVHTSEPITHLCFTCEIKPLCIKCVSGSKRHATHELKQLHKAIPLLSEQLTCNQLDVNNKIQEMELLLRRLDDRNMVIKDRGSKILADIQNGFADLFQRLEEKQQQVIKSCQDHFAGLIQHINQQNQNINKHIDLLKSHKQKIAVIQRSSTGIDLISKFMDLKNELGAVLLEQPFVQLQKKIVMPSSSIFRQITDISQQITNMRVNFKYSNFCRIGASELENCPSEGKLKKDSSQSKRVKTNFASLNSSREKRQKKYTKTEEDQRRVKGHKTIGKGIQKKNKMPTYISDFINKKSSKIGSDGSSMGMQMTSPNFQNTSKITSKLSKTLAPEEIMKKKKDNSAAIKERIERRTAGSKPCSRKKKTH